MENPFKELWQPHIEVPKEIKQNIKNSIALYKLFGDVTNLFTNNYIEASKSVLTKNNNQLNNKLNNNKNGKIK